MELTKENMIQNKEISKNNKKDLLSYRSSVEKTMIEKIIIFSMIVLFFIFYTIIKSYWEFSILLTIVLLGTVFAFIKEFKEQK